MTGEEETEIQYGHVTAVKVITTMETTIVIAATTMVVIVTMEAGVTKVVVNHRSMG